MNGEICRCGHQRSQHNGLGSWPAAQEFNVGTCLHVKPTDPDVALGGIPCGCRAYDHSVLPKPGERLVFGQHRLPSPAAETAAAWPTLEQAAAERRAAADRVADAAIAKEATQ